MNEEEKTRKGLLEGGSRILTELLSTPKVRQTIRILLRELDPENAGLLVAALTRTDPELFLSALSRSADAANAVVAGGQALLEELLRFPPAIEAELAAGLLRDLDAERLGNACGLLAVLLARIAAQNPAELSQVLGDRWRDFLAGFAQAASRDEPSVGERLASLIAAWEEAAARPAAPLHDRVRRLAAGIEAGAARYPHLLAKVVAPLVAAGHAAVIASTSNLKGGEND